MNKRILPLAIVLVLVAGVVTLFAMSMSNGDKTTQTGTTDSSAEDVTHSGGEGSANTSESSNSVAAELNSVSIKDFAFSPSTITVKKGTKVTWTNQDSTRHDIAPDNETSEFKKSDLLGKGQSYEVTFNTVGEYTYHCTPHPQMTGKVIVTE